MDRVAQRDPWSRAQNRTLLTAVHPDRAFFRECESDAGRVLLSSGEAMFSRPAHQRRCRA